jgi:hypothetical protein
MANNDDWPCGSRRDELGEEIGLYVEGLGGHLAPAISRAVNAERSYVSPEMRDDERHMLVRSRLAMQQEHTRSCPLVDNKKPP